VTSIGSIYSEGRPLRRLLLVLLLLAGLAPSLLAVQRGVGHVSSSTYDVSGVVRVGVLRGWLVPSESSLVSSPLEQSASQFLGVGRASTTSSRSFVATNTVDDILPTPVVSNTKLQNIVNDLYKGTTNPGRVGTGTTADAVRNELATGLATGGKFHSEKAQIYINGLNKVLKQDLTASDRLVAQSLLDDLTNALGGVP
jgi:hypothetical protein